MNFQTCLRLVIQETHRQAAADIEMASIAIINAMDFYKARSFPFNKGWQRFFIPEGADRITALQTPVGFPATRAGMPHGVMRPIVIQVVGIVTSGDVNTGLGNFEYTPVHQEPLRQIDPLEMWSNQGGTGVLSTASRGFPRVYAWLGGANEAGNAIRIAPVAHTNLVADILYLEDSHRLRYRWNPDAEGGAWAFEQLIIVQGATVDFWKWGELLPDFTNVWLTHAEPLIRARATYDLWLNFYHDEKAAALAQRSMIEQERRIEDERVSGYIGQLQRKPTCL